MEDKRKPSPLAISALTGVTALVGGIEPAAADSISLSQSFGTLSASDHNTSSTRSGSESFSGTDSDATTFSQFDSMGGAGS